MGDEGGTLLRVLVVAADPLARAGLATLLAPIENAQVVGMASDTDEPLRAIETFRPDVVLMGLGWDAHRIDRVAAFAAGDVPVLALLGGAAEPSDVAALWEAGLRGLLERDSSSEQVAAALGAVGEGLAIFDPRTAALPPAIQPREGDEPLVEALTARELEVLYCLADGLSNKQIARQLGISEHTVKYHVNAILGKMNAQSRTEAVVRATRAGILLL
jgi:DNA-binding NarL/FixJ family response regulator